MADDLSPWRATINEVSYYSRLNPRHTERVIDAFLNQVEMHLAAGRPFKIPDHFTLEPVPPEPPKRLTQINLVPLPPLRKKLRHGTPPSPSQ